MNRAIFIVFAVAFALAVISLSTFVGFRSGPESKFEVKPDKNTILFGVTPWGDPRQMKEAYKPLLDYLSEKIGKKFQLLIMENYDVAIDNIVEGNIDVSVISPVCYVLAKEKEPQIQYISTITRDHGGKPVTVYKGYIVATKFKYANFTIDDFLKSPKKYKLGLVTKASASGWAYPVAMFKKRGIDPSDVFKSVEIYDNHAELTDAIAAGKTDLGATWEYNLEKAREKYGDIFTIVYTTDDIPGLSWVASKKIDLKFLVKLRQIQMEINESPELKEKLLKDTPEKGWAIVDDKIYDTVREVVKYVGKFQ